MRPDSTRRDSVPRLDTIKGRPVRDTAVLHVPLDSVKAPLSRAEAPLLVDIGHPYRWDRDALFASGALTLADLLARIPGATIFRSGWIATPAHATYLGDPRRVRVFYDGLELDALDPHTGGILDLGEVQLWTLEDVAVERGADEMRIYLRSWRVERTTAYSRTDVVTGDENTNLYRGYFGKRFRNGSAVQLAGQQFGTSSPLSGSGDALSLLGRLGVARPRWSVDAYVLHSSRSRDLQVGLFADSVPALEATRTDAYVRAGLGDPEAGAWAQLTAATLDFTSRASSALSGFGLPTGTSAPDSSTSHTQYVGAAGFSRWGLRLSGTGRIDRVGKESEKIVSGRASFDRSLLALSLFAERRGDSVSSLELAGRLMPLSFVSVEGAATRRRLAPPSSAPFDVSSVRVEAGLRVGGLWLTGGMLDRGAVPAAPALRIFGANSYADADLAKGTGQIGRARGLIWKDIGADAFVIRWDRGDFYLPQLQSREELYLMTRWMSRFPSGHFGLLASAAHEYRRPTAFPVRPEGDGPTPGVRFSTYRHDFEGRLEIRILDAVLFFDFRRGIRPFPGDLVPGFFTRQQISLYGVRWEFWN
ncbi:MAG: Plug domain-containing protein [Gemmatimonadota bacterium]|nr:Plug domain-containing protein [Gemmatimonadota bacterium]